MRFSHFLAATITIGSIGAAVPVAAGESVTLTSAGIYNPGHVDVTTGGTTKSEFAVPVTLTATSVKSSGFDAIGFCVDLAHNIFVGVGGQLATSLKYHVVPLTTDGYGQPLSTMQANEMLGLAKLGFGIAASSDSDKSARLAAIQQAIWTIEYPASTFAATGDFAAAQTGFAAQYVAMASKLTGFARTIVADDGTTQAFITNIGGVPEPLIWAQLVVGFGLVGSLARRRNRPVTVAA